MSQSEGTSFSESIVELFGRSLMDYAEGSDGILFHLLDDSVTMGSSS